MPDKDADLFEGKLSDEKLEDLFWESYNASREVFRNRKKRWKRNIDAYGSEFLSNTERAYLKSTDRPPVELNLLTGKMNAIRGAMMAQRQEVQFKPHTSGDEASVKGGWMTTLVRKAMNDCEGHRQQEAAFFNCLCTGYGAAEIYLDTSRIPFRGTLKRVRLKEIWPDPDASEMCLMDKSTDHRVREWLVEQVIARWPEKKKEIEAAVVAMGTFARGGRKRTMGKAAADSLRGRVKVAEFIYQRWLPRVRWYDPEREERRDTSPVELEERRKELKKTLDNNGNPKFEEIVEEEYRGETWFRAYLLIDAGADTNKRGKNSLGFTVLEHVESPRVGSTLEWVTGLEKDDPTEEGVVEFFGLLEIGYGLQMVLNRTIQEELAILAREAKGGFRYTDAAVPNGYPGGEAQWVKDFSKPGGAKKLAQEGWEMFAQDDLPRIPSGLDRLEQKLVDWIGQALVIPDAMTGAVQQERSAVYLSNLQAQGMVTLGPVLDPYVVFIKRCGIAMAQILIRHLPTADIDRLLDYPQVAGMTHEADEDGVLAKDEQGQPIPIMVDDPDKPIMEETQDPATGELLTVQATDPETGEPAFEQMPVTAGMILKDEDPLDYDCVVDTGQATVSLRYAIWEMVEQGILQTMQNALPPEAFQKFVLFMVRNMPVPGEQGVNLAKEIEKVLEDQAELQEEQGITDAVVKLGAEKATEILSKVAQALGIPPPGEAPAGKPPSTSIKFADLPPDGQVQLAKQAGIDLSAGMPGDQENPEEMAAEGGMEEPGETAPPPPVQ